MHRCRVCCLLAHNPFDAATTTSSCLEAYQSADCSVSQEGRKEMDPTSGKKVMMLMKKKAKTIKNVPQKYIAVRVACMYVPR